MAQKYYRRTSYRKCVKNATRARQTTAVITNFRKYDKNSLESRAGANRSNKIRGRGDALKFTTKKLDVCYKDQSVNSVQDNKSFVEPFNFCLLPIVQGFKNSNKEYNVA